MLKTAKSKSGFHIGVTCPGCGGKLELQEDFFVLSCEYCGSVLRIAMPDTPPAYLIKGEMPKMQIRFHIDRYLKKKGLPLTGSRIEIKSFYFPYWKINAVILKVRNKKIERFSGQTDDQGRDISYEKEMTDIRLTPYTNTIAANSAYPHIPHSIGMRSEDIKLDPFAKDKIDENFACLPATKNWQQSLAELDKTINTIGRLETADFGKNRTDLFHPRGSVVYFPYIIVNSDHCGTTREFIIDGVSGRILQYNEQPLFTEEPSIEDKQAMEFGKLEVNFHRCDNCGVDLPDEQSSVYICRNCLKLILMEQTPFNIDQINMTEGTTKGNDRMFPFWSFKMSEQDQARIGTMFGGIYSSDRIVIPGFKMANFEAMFRLAKRFSSAVKTINLVPIDRRLDERFESVSLPLSEALTMADVIIYREMIGKGMEKSFTAEFQPIEATLFFAPFHPESYFYVDSIQGAITFEKSLIE